MNSAYFCLGIDPNPKSEGFKEWSKSLEVHDKTIEDIQSHLKHKFMKLQLAFFLNQGHKGIEKLEEFTEKYKNNFHMILDGKFNEIENSLKGYLDFTFKQLGAKGVTINPYLGEKTIISSLEYCIKHAGPQGRVYVLLRTSESSQHDLSYLQNSWQKMITSLTKIKENIAGSKKDFEKILGVVVGAKETNVLFSRELQESRLSVLVPGLGHQGGTYDVIEQSKKYANEFVFTLSRSLFAGGNITASEACKNILNTIQHF